MTKDLVDRLKSVSGEAAPYANPMVLNWCHQAAFEIERLRAHVEALQQKIDADKSCACAYDAPGDVCLPHSPHVARLEAENARLRTALADAIRRPMGVVPESADGLVMTADLDAAEARRVAKEGK